MVHPEEEELDDELEDPEPYLLDDLSFLFRYLHIPLTTKNITMSDKKKIMRSLVSPLGILKQVFARGYAAWKKGHVPGTTPQQWAHARVSSFITGGKTTKMSDKKLYQQALKNRKKEKKQLTRDIYIIDGRNYI